MDSFCQTALPGKAGRPSLSLTPVTASVLPASSSASFSSSSPSCSAAQMISDSDLCHLDTMQPFHPGVSDKCLSAQSVDAFFAEKFLSSTVDLLSNDSVTVLLPPPPLPLPPPPPPPPSLHAGGLLYDFSHDGLEFEPVARSTIDTPFSDSDCTPNTPLTPLGSAHVHFLFPDIPSSGSNQPVPPAPSPVTKEVGTTAGDLPAFPPARPLADVHDGGVPVDGYCSSSPAPTPQLASDAIGGLRRVGPAAFRLPGPSGCPRTSQPGVGPGHPAHPAVRQHRGRSVGQRLHAEHAAYPTGQDSHPLHLSGSVPRQCFRLGRHRASNRRLEKVAQERQRVRVPLRLEPAQKAASPDGQSGEGARGGPEEAASGGPTPVNGKG